MLDKGENKVMVLGVIGAGNMAQAIIAGIKKSHSLDCKNIIVSNYNKQKAARLSEEYGVLTDDNINLLKQCEEQKFEIENLKKDLEKTKKESKLFFLEKNKFEEQFINLSKEHSNLKNKADKLTRITYGKLFKK